MSVNVVVPDKYFGDIMGDLSSRRGVIENTQKQGNANIIDAKVPLNQMFGYATRLRSLSQGRGIYTMQFSKYNIAPKSVVEELFK